MIMIEYRDIRMSPRQRRRPSDHHRTQNHQPPNRLHTAFSSQFISHILYTQKTAKRFQLFHIGTQFTNAQGGRTLEYRKKAYPRNASPLRSFPSDQSSSRCSALTKANEYDFCAFIENKDSEFPMIYS
tara:strand:- start:32404 stop:32787 length:384 start_codon:yes stop_codon:yes gene_type:complete